MAGDESPYMRNGVPPQDQREQLEQTASDDVELVFHTRNTMLAGAPVCQRYALQTARSEIYLPSHVYLCVCLRRCRRRTREFFRVHPRVARSFFPCLRLRTSRRRLLPARGRFETHLHKTLPRLRKRRLCKGGESVVHSFEACCAQAFSNSPMFVTAALPSYTKSIESCDQIINQGAAGVAWRVASRSKF